MSEGELLRKAVMSIALVGTTFLPLAAIPATEVGAGNPTVMATSTVERRNRDSQIGTSIVTSASRWQAYVKRRLGELEDGLHDFTDLKIPSTSAIQRARTIAGDTFRFDTPTPSVVPSEEGAVLFVWHKAGWDVEVEVTEIAANVWANRREDSTGWYGPLSEHVVDFDRLLHDFSRA